MEGFVKKGGILVTTYWSGMVDENDLCFLGGFPGPLRQLTGIWAEEIDTLYDSEENGMVLKNNNSLGIYGRYKTVKFCELIHTESAEVLAEYESDFYKGRPALTVNSVGEGKAYHMAARCENSFLNDFYDCMIAVYDLKKAINAALPEGVTAQLRSDGKKKYMFIMNFSEEEKTVDLGDGHFFELISGSEVAGMLVLKPYGVAVLES